jgi:ribosomal protein S18 acetylase RimI-like enzyme
MIRTTAGQPGLQVPRRIDAPAEVNYANPPAADFGPLARDRVPVRAIQEADLRAIVEIDRQITGRDRSDYLARKLDEAIQQSDVRISLVAEVDGRAVGFVMARVDIGEFGLVEPTAVIDTLGVHVDCRNQGIGRALLSQLLVNLMTLRVESVRTDIEWHDHELLAFFDRCGFRYAQRLCLAHALAN